MNGIRDIRLEFLRSGPAHNQLLSPLTPYLALCGADGPVSVNMPFEHAQLLNRLHRLRYEIDGVAVAPAQRQAELQELGEAIARVLAGIPALVAELRSARAETDRLVNVRLAISAFELGLVPFEATMAPADASGSGAPLLLGTLTSMTREIRRGQPLPLHWDRPPRILYAFASPAGLPPVPAQAHLEALRRAIDPWIPMHDTPEARVAEVRKMLTVLKDASASRISTACQTGDYTHVHILAHGAPMAGSDNRRFGVMLGSDEPGRSVVVDGQSLALALRGVKSSGQVKPPPTVVTLATCDSGNAGGVLTPGGSIAHELHAQDIPWVIASQFPLWMRASNIATEILYRGLLAGDDPRWVLYELRQRLRIELPETHDWASIVAYAAIPADLPAQVEAFRSRQTRRRIEVKFARMDELVAAPSGEGAGAEAPDASAEVTLARQEAVRDELQALCAAIRQDLATWCAEAAADDAAERAERLGMSAASEKRIAIVYQQRGNAELSTAAYREARRCYESAMRAAPLNHWVLTQFLSMAATPSLAAEPEALAKLKSELGPLWRIARHLAQWESEGPVQSARVWARATLLELELLGAVYGDALPADGSAAARERVLDHCHAIAAMAAHDPFPVHSTRRQLARYAEHWQRVEWEPLVAAALEGLQDSGSAHAARST